MLVVGQAKLIQAVTLLSAVQGNKQFLTSLLDQVLILAGLSENLCTSFKQFAVALKLLDDHRFSDLEWS